MTLSYLCPKYDFSDSKIIRNPSPKQPSPSKRRPKPQANIMNHMSPSNLKGKLKVNPKKTPNKPQTIAVFRPKSEIKGNQINDVVKKS